MKILLPLLLISSVCLTLNSASNEVGYYWLDYNGGKIPENALKIDESGPNSLYVGQVYTKEYELLPATIGMNRPLATFNAYNKELSSDKNIKLHYYGNDSHLTRYQANNTIFTCRIPNQARNVYQSYKQMYSNVSMAHTKVLCSQYKENFVWIRTSASAQAYKYLPNLVVGGYEVGGYQYFGRIYRNGKLVLGKLAGALALPLAGHEQYVYDNIEVLTYKPTHDKTPVPS